MVWFEWEADFHVSIVIRAWLVSNADIDVFNSWAKDWRSWESEMAHINRDSVWPLIKRECNNVPQGLEDRGVLIIK